MRFVLLLLAAVLSAETTLLEGKRIHYTLSGTGSIPLVFLHGWGGDLTVFAQQTQAFARTHRVITLDLPGHGQSDPLPKPSIETFSRVLDAVLKATHSSRPILCGHSLGAVVARQWARLHPNQARALLLLDPAIYQLPPGAADRERWAEGIRRLAQSFGPAHEKTVRERAISVFLSNLYVDSTPRDLRMSVLRLALTPSPQTAESTLAALADLSLWIEDSLPLPVLVLRAGLRQPPGEDRFLKSLFPQLSYHFLPGVSHYLMWEDPARINTELRRFLEERKLP
jgi:pimeloyl-ACP methyl ester carboxylesterase